MVSDPRVAVPGGASPESIAPFCEGWRRLMDSALVDRLEGVDPTGSGQPPGFLPTRLTSSEPDDRHSAE